MTSRQQALIAINEALRALDYVPELPKEIDNDTAEAQLMLVWLRSQLTDHEWPELPAPNEEKAEAWFLACAKRQMEEGLL